ncbi:unnamed protein product [Soboliphyme baturini]|uniref:Secreted protein n=1 Tax=Soboliphyme baturini TaxID=241478 RepID=A0A183ICE5_9BILA|nr:unnamed protein product [Soboliphyme baturini]
MVRTATTVTLHCAFLFCRCTNFRRLSLRRHRRLLVAATAHFCAGPERPGLPTTTTAFAIDCRVCPAPGMWFAQLLFLQSVGQPTSQPVSQPASQPVGSFSGYR